MRTPSILAVLGAATFSAPAFAGVFYVSLGTGLAPATLGPSSLPLTPAQVDSQPLGWVTSVALSPAVSANFQNPAFHGAAPLWWGRGYSGSVYSTAGDQSLTVTMSGTNQVDAILFYVMPNPYGVFTIQTTGTDGTTATTTSAFATGGPANSGRAIGLGFYGTGSSKITSFIVSCDTDFSIGEFYYHNPSPSAAALLGLAAARRKRR